MKITTDRLTMTLFVFGCFLVSNGCDELANAVDGSEHNGALDLADSATNFSETDTATAEHSETPSSQVDTLHEQQVNATDLASSDNDGSLEPWDIDSEGANDEWSLLDQSDEYRSSRVWSPKIKGVALDYCLMWGRDCGRPAANMACALSGYWRATGYRKENSPNNPTYNIGASRICRGSGCDTFRWVDCAEAGSTAHDPNESGIEDAGDFESQNVRLEGRSLVSRINFYDKYEGLSFFFYLDIDDTRAADYAIYCDSEKFVVKKSDRPNKGSFGITLYEGTPVVSGTEYRISFPIQVLDPYKGFNFWLYSMSSKDRLPNSGQVSFSS